MNMEQRREVMNRKFKALSVNEDGLVNMNSVRELFRDVGFFIGEVLPEGRYKAMVLTNLEQACMWAIKSITHEGDFNG